MSAAARPSAPNIIIFMPDEMRADSLACYGNPASRTPNFDRLAGEGARFAECHVQFPVCGASRCSMMTGWPASVRGHRSLSYFLRPDEPNLFRYLKGAGYDVFWFGKNDLLAAQSFPDSVTRWTDRVGGYSAQSQLRPLDGEANTFLFGPMGDRRDTWDYGLLRLALEVLERTQQDAPFCVFLPMSQPHPPYTAPADFYDLISPDDVPDLAPPGLPGKPDFHAALRESYGLDRVPEATFRKIRAVYLGQVAFTDWLLGELMEAMERTGRAKDTALFVLSDHGDYAGDYGLVEKWPSGLEDALTRVPLLARVPGGVAGRTVETMVEAYDVMATCLDLAGITARHTHFARSFLPQLQGAAPDAGRAAFAEAGYNVYEPQCFEPPMQSLLYGRKAALQNDRPETISRAAMIRTQTAKLILRPQSQSELYDLSADPRELRNLWGEAGAAGLQQSLQLRLLEWFVNTTGVAPPDRDQRGSPQFYPPVSMPATDLAAILDR
jgi:choline-sulfatase